MAIYIYIKIHIYQAAAWTIPTGKQTA